MGTLESKVNETCTNTNSDTCVVLISESDWTENESNSRKHDSSWFEFTFTWFDDKSD